MIRLIPVLVLALLSPDFAAAQALKEIRVGSSNISVTNVVAYYAQDRKFFQAEGFDVKMIIIKTEATLPALVAGDLDYSTLSTSAIEAALNGLPLRVINLACVSGTTGSVLLLIAITLLAPSLPVEPCRYRRALPPWASSHARSG